MMVRMAVRIGLLEYRVHPYFVVWRYRQGDCCGITGDAGGRIRRHLPHRDIAFVLPGGLEMAIVPLCSGRDAFGNGRIIWYGILGLHGKLALFLVPSLLLGLLLRRPVIRFNDWIIRNLESTKVM